jgi:signal transduction histidine kinase
MEFGGEHLSFVLFVYGLTFFSLGLAVSLEIRRKRDLPLSRHLLPLALFGFLHAGAEWSEMLTLYEGGHASAILEALSSEYVYLGFLATSAFALVWFGSHLLAEAGGRWRLFRLAPLGIGGTWVVMMAAGHHLGYSDDGSWSTLASIWTRYLLYLPGSLLAGLALAHQARAVHMLGMPEVARDCRRTGAVFGVNALVAGLVVSPASFFPASVVNFVTFQDLLGVPPHVLRAGAAVGIAVFVIRILRLFDLHLRSELERFAGRALMAQEEERKRVARELHDETAQLLSSLLVRLTLVDQSAMPEEARRRHGELVALATRSVEGVRRLAVELRPPELDDLGLVEAIRWHLDDFSGVSGVGTRLQVSGPTDRLPPTTELALYRIVQEAIANVGKHSGARTALVSLERHDGTVTVKVEDDGAGFDVARTLAGKDRGIGLFGMHERAELLGGKMSISSEVGRGTSVTAQLPVAQGATR